MNNNPTSWETKSLNVLKIFAFNCQSLKPKLGHIRSDPIANQGDALCLSESWLMSDILEKELEIEHYKIDLNSSGKGKGLLPITMRQSSEQHRV